MRRFASVFVSKHDRPRSDNDHSPAPLLVHSPPHSSASSSGSASLSIRTPDDDHPSLLPASTAKRSWKSWFSGKRAPSLRPSSKLTRSLSNIITSPPSPNSKRTPPSPAVPALTTGAEDTDHDSHSEVSADDLLPPSFSPPSSLSSSPSPFPSPFPSPLPPSLPLARHNLALITSHLLVSPPAPSPFMQHSSGPLFPRSSNPSALLPRRPNSMLSSMLRKRLLKRLEDPALMLSPAEERSLLPFSTRPVSAVTLSPTLSTAFPDDDSRPDPSTTLFAASPGLRSWIARPCFEDRHSIVLPLDDAFHHSPIASAFAVAALEYSDAIDAMVDPDFDPSSPQSNNVSTVPFSEIDLPSPALDNPVPPNESSSTQPGLARPSSSSYKKELSPTPLRHQTPPSLQSPPASMPVPNLAPSPTPAVKRVVRFADSDDDEDDGTPLYIVRAKKKREEKAKFLRREQLRRMAEQDKERRAREEELQRQKEEFMERERKQLAKEQEKKERDRRLYAEEVVAARLRRESYRAGMVSNTSSPLIPSSSSSASLGDTESIRLRDSTKRRSHVPQLSRKEVSDTALPTISTSRSFLHPQGSSSGGSRPPSGVYSPASVSHSRPPSTYSHSSDEVRQIGLVGAGSKRSSLAASASGSYRPVPDRSWTMPNWGGSTQSLHPVPPVPAMPDYLSMPLLPPTAPFMMTQYPKRQSSPSPGSSSGSRRGGSANSSSERINHHAQAHPQQRQDSHSPRHSSSPHRPTHERRSSGDPRRSSMPSSPSQGSLSTRSRSRSSTIQPAPRGRMIHPAQQQQQQQQPNPWTALPSQLGRPPVAMPVSSYSHGNVGTPKGTNGETSRGTHRKSIYS